MEKDIEFIKIYYFARKNLKLTNVSIAKLTGAPSGASVQMWEKNGVPHKYRNELKKQFYKKYKEHCKKQSQENNI